MITIKSYLKRADRFVLLEELTERLPCSEYVEGAIEIRVEQTTYLGTKFWDLVDQLWCYLIQGLSELRAGKRFETHFPDQPVRFIMAPRSDQVHSWLMIELDGEVAERVSVNTSEWIRACARAGQEFFVQMSELLPQKKQGYTRMAAACEAYLDEEDRAKTKGSGVVDCD